MAERALEGRDGTADDGLRAGTIAGVTAYSLWGLFPLVFHRLGSVSALEVLIHRVLWSFVVVTIVLVARRDHAWVRPLVREPRRVAQLGAAALCIATNWLLYIWAVQHDHVVEAALGYYINPLITVALGVVILGERLRTTQLAALGLGAASVAVLTVAYGRLPWIAIVLAISFASYGFLKKSVRMPAAQSLAVETAMLVPVAAVGLAAFETTGHAAFLHGSGGRDMLLVSLGIITAIPLLLFGAAATRIPLSLLGLLQYLTPTLQLLCGVLLLGESLSAARLLGFVLVWGALILLGTDAVRAARGRRGESAPEIVPLAEPA